jgi:hypothetical protein
MKAIFKRKKITAVILPNSATNYTLEFMPGCSKVPGILSHIVK